MIKIQIQSILYKPSFKKAFFKKENNKVTKINEIKYFNLYDKSWSDKSIEVLAPLTKEN